MSDLIAKYENGGYVVEIFKNGTKVRTAIDKSIPPVLPEQMDLKITDWCDAGCAWCHEKSTTKGVHADLNETIKLLSQLNPGTEIAIGGGDPLSHPDFESFVLEARKIGLVPSVTVNGRHFDKHKPMLERLITKNSLFGVGVSYFDKLPEWDYEHMVVHLIAGINHPEILREAQKRYKLLILGYKKFGRGKKLFELRSNTVQDNLSAWYRELFWVAQKHHLSFDNLGIEQLKPYRLFKSKNKYETQYMGPEGEFSMYIDAVTKTFALSSYSEERQNWSNMKQMFSNIRSSQGFRTSC